MAEWLIEADDSLTFTVEVTLFIGFIFICIILLLLRNRFPQLTTNGWIELLIGAFFIALKGLFDGLDTIVQNEVLHDVFDGLEASLIFIGLILLGIGLIRMTIFSAKVWEVR